MNLKEHRDAPMSINGLNFAAVCVEEEDAAVLLPHSH
jgi:hypothetical protein